jgi:hypothetical protein
MDEQTAKVVNLMLCLGPVWFHQDRAGAVDRLRRHRHFRDPDDVEGGSQERCAQEVKEEYARWSRDEHIPSDVHRVLIYQYHYWELRALTLTPQELDQHEWGAKLGNRAFAPVWRMNYPLYPDRLFSDPTGAKWVADERARFRSRGQFLADPREVAGYTPTQLELGGYFGVYDVVMVDQTRIGQPPPSGS